MSSNTVTTKSEKQLPAERFEVGDLIYTVAEGMLVVRRILGVRAEGYTWCHSDTPTKVFDSEVSNDPLFQRNWKYAREFLSKSRKEQFMELAETIPESWLTRWCGGGICGCLGCANNSGSLVRDVMLINGTTTAKLHKGFSKAEYDLYLPDAIAMKEKVF